MDEKGRVVVEIRDTGEDISAGFGNYEDFVPFFTDEVAIGSPPRSGCSTSHGIVTALGGNLQVRARWGRARLPRGPRAAARASATVPLAKASEPALALQRGRVLVVDDDPMLVPLVRRVLGTRARRGGRDEPPRGVPAPPFGGSRSVDVILCDSDDALRMTPMHFHEHSLPREAGRRAEYGVLSGGAFTSRAREFLERVPNERFEKPFDLGAMRSLVRRFVATLTARAASEAPRPELKASPPGGQRGRLELGPRGLRCGARCESRRTPHQ